jgi:hypothetical protein
MSYSKKIAYSISKISIPRNEMKQTGPEGNPPDITALKNFAMMQAL